MTRMPKGPAIEQLGVSAFTVPTEVPESNGATTWESVTVVAVELLAAGTTGLGYTFGDRSVAALIDGLLRPVVEGSDPLDLEATWQEMRRRSRAAGASGIGALGVSAIDLALWDLKARLLDMPTSQLLGRARQSVAAYGSGGFTSLSLPELEGQLAGWIAQGIPRVKMQVGRRPSEDPERVAAVRATIGPDAELYLDASGAYGRKEALAMAELFADVGVSWIEEPVRSDDIDGLRLLRDRAPAGVEIAAGSDAASILELRRLLEARAVDVLQADATRCGGFTGFMQIAALCSAFGVPLSACGAPALSVFAGCAAAPLRHVELPFDHVRIEGLLFDGVPQPVGGLLTPVPSRPGHGLELRRQDAARYSV
jgi:L-alanine-DL-glutamate epimerase-like enolase superfamily enzyme